MSSIAEHFADQRQAEGEKYIRETFGYNLNCLSPKQRIVLRRFFREKIIPLKDMDDLELGCLGKLKKEYFVEILYMVDGSKAAALIGIVP